MPEQTVIAVFAASGTAEDARNRLRTEGYAEADVEFRELAAIGPVPPTLAPESDTIDPALSTAVPEDELRQLHYREAAVAVRVREDGEAQDAATLLRLYAPLRVEILTPAEEAAFWSSLEQQGAAAR